ncbi:MAG: RluA family pseudouridine synthase [Acidobacteriota bacterium]
MKLRVPPEVSGVRLDRFLSDALEQPRNQIQRWLRNGDLLVDGKLAKVSQTLRGGELVSGDLPDPAERETLSPESGDLVVLHEDEYLLVIDKPPGLTVHPGAGRSHGTLVHRLLDRYPELAGVGGPGRPGIVHRLDKDTSGVMVIARTAAAYRSLTAAFAARGIKKTYVAIVYGNPRPLAAEISAAIGRHPSRRTQMAVRANGKPGITRYRTAAAQQGIAWLEVELLTGRTHQIRVHMKHIGNPLVGDPVYGEARWRALPVPVQRTLREFPRPALHAWSIAFQHPGNAALVRFSAAIPADLNELWLQVAGEPLPA